MSQPQFEDRPVGPGLPEVVDDDSPERDRYPEPEAPALPSDEGYPGAAAVGTTVQEQIEGESLDRKLAQEVPEPAVDPLAPLDPDEQVYAEDATADDEAGQLVAPDLGSGADTEKDEVAQELAGAYDGAPEEQAMHVVEPGQG